MEMVSPTLIARATAAANGAPRTDGPSDPDLRPRVDGKFFARGLGRWRPQGVTYGPFAPGADGEPFPRPELVRADFGAMRAAGVNAIRTYHLPPEWLLHRADEQGL